MFASRRAARAEGFGIAAPDPAQMDFEIGEDFFGGHHARAAGFESVKHNGTAVGFSGERTFSAPMIQSIGAATLRCLASLIVASTRPASSRPILSICPMSDLTEAGCRPLTQPSQSAASPKRTARGSSSKAGKATADPFSFAALLGSWLGSFPTLAPDPSPAALRHKGSFKGSFIRDSDEGSFTLSLHDSSPFLAPIFTQPPLKGETSFTISSPERVKLASEFPALRVLMTGRYRFVLLRPPPVSTLRWPRSTSPSYSPKLGFRLGM
jgi:hypothetical protein